MQRSLTALTGFWQQAEAACPSALRSAVGAANWSKALVLLSSLSGRPGLPLQAICSSLLSRLARKGQWQAALTFFHSLPQLCIAFTPGIYSSLLSAHAQKHLWQHALHLLNLAQLRKFGPASAKNLDTAVFNSVITSCARASKWQWSICLLGNLREAVSECKANRTSFNASLNACERRGLWTHALVLLELMREDQVTPDSASLNCTMSACEKGQQWAMALTLLERFSAHKCERTMVTYGAVVAASVVGSAWEVALACMTEAVQMGFSPDNELLNSMTESCRRAWAWPYCLSLLAQGQEQGLNSKIRVVATRHAVDFAQKASDRLGIGMGELAPLAAALQLSEISQERFEWTGRHPAVIVSNDWLQQANDLGSYFIRHSLECPSGFAQPGFKTQKKTVMDFMRPPIP